MALHTDIPAPEEIQQLVAHREPASVSIYVSTSPTSTDNENARLEFKNAVREAVRQLQDNDVPRATIEAISGFAETLRTDGRFWSYVSNSLAVFLTAKKVRTYRLPNQLTATVQVSDRFHLKPLLRAVTFPHTAFVLALSQNSARLVEVTRDSPAMEVQLETLPQNIDAAVPAVEDGRETSNRLIALQGDRVRLEQYARAVDRSLRPLFTGSQRPLIIAAAEPLASIYRSVSSLPNLAPQGIGGNPESRTDAELASAARRVLDQRYSEDIAAIRRLITDDAPRDRVALDLQKVARAATFGAVDTLLVDIDAHQPGLLDHHTGAITFSAGDAEDYGVGDEIVRRALETGAKVLAVRADEVPGDKQVAALLRYPV